MRRPDFRLQVRPAVLGTLLLAGMTSLGWSLPASAAAGKSAATITGTFTDSCRDFQSRSTKFQLEAPKDTGHVEIHYADGRVVKDESVDGPDYSIDGNVGDEIDSVLVKSGTTTEQFECSGVNGPPVAVLDIKTPAEPVAESAGALIFNGLADRTVWTSADSVSFCFFSWCTGVTGGCSPCPPDHATVRYRGVTSRDPNADIVGWSIDFGDDTSTGPRVWATDPPEEVVHAYRHASTAVLTVTDSAGQSHSDAMTVDFSIPD